METSTMVNGLVTRLYDHRIEMIPADQSSAPFFAYLARPSWFKEHLRAPFDANRQACEGMIFLMHRLDSARNETTVGCVYCEIRSKHLTYGEPTPTFGWIQADSEPIFRELMRVVERYVQQHGGTQLRGPINPPKTFGGYGVHIKTFDLPSLVGLSEIPVGYAEWLKDYGYHVDAEYVTLHLTHVHPVPPQPTLTLESPSIQEVFANPTLLQEVVAFIQSNFAGKLPDTATPERTFEIFQRLAQMPNHQAFYVLARDTSRNNQLAGLMLEIPNWLESFAGQPITMTNLDTTIVGKAYRGVGLFHLMYAYLHPRVVAQGIQWEEGGMVWKDNTAGIKCFAHNTEWTREYAVFQKKLG